MPSARTPAELRELVERAADLLLRTGNEFYAADLYASAAYAALCLGSDADATEFVARATPAVRDLENRSEWMMLRGNAGTAALFTGDAQAARAAFREELELCRELAVRPIAGEGLAGLAALSAAAGEHERAARLSGAALAHRYEQPISPADERLRARFLDPARERWGAEAWDEAFRRGAAMGFEEAIALALEDGDA